MRNEVEALWQRDSIGLTPLHWAVKRNDFDIVEFLLFFNASAKAEDIFGRTPLSVLNEDNSYDIIHVSIFKVI